MRSAGRLGRRSAALLGIVVLAVALVPSVARAHARLVKSDPARRAKVAAAPAAVRLWFNEAIEADFSRLSLSRADGSVVADAAKVDPEDAKLLVLDVPPGLPAGTYTVTFEVLSVDGHRVKQSFPFTVKGETKAPPGE